MWHLPRNKYFAQTVLHLASEHVQLGELERTNWSFPCFQNFYDTFISTKSDIVAKPFSSDVDMVSDIYVNILITVIFWEIFDWKL